jgi:hypothetical protein
MVSVRWTSSMGTKTQDLKTGDDFVWQGLTTLRIPEMVNFVWQGMTFLRMTPVSRIWLAIVH